LNHLEGRTSNRRRQFERGVKNDPGFQLNGPQRGAMVEGKVYSKTGGKTAIMRKINRKKLREPEKEGKSVRDRSVNSVVIN